MCNIFINTLSELSFVGSDNDILFVKGYHETGDGGGGIFVYKADEPRSNHNGGTIIDPTKEFPTTWNDTDKQNDWFNTTNTGSGCWVRQIGEYVTPEMFGAKGDGTSDDTKALQQTIDVASTFANKVFLDKGVYLISEDIVLKENVVLESCIKSLGYTSNAPIDLIKGAVIRWDINKGKPTNGVLVSNINGDKQIANSGVLNIVIDANGAENAVVLAGWSEQCVFENVEIIQYKEYGLKIIPTTKGIPNNETIFKNIRLVGKKNSNGLYLDNVESCLFESFVFDISSTEDNNAEIGINIYNNCNRNTFINTHIENYNKPIRIGTIGVDNNSNNNIFISGNIGYKDYEASIDTIGDVSGKIAISVNGNIVYSIHGFRFIGSNYGWDYLLVDTSRDIVINGRKLSSGIDFIQQCNMTFNWINGKYVFKSDTKEVLNNLLITDKEKILNENDTTPSIKGYYRVGTNNTTATTITNFTNGVEGQLLEVRARDGNTTIQDINNGGNFILSGGQDYTMTGGSVITFRLISGIWRELSRMSR
jgi:hypothetical protein